MVARNESNSQNFLLQETNEHEGSFTRHILRTRLPFTLPSSQVIIPNLGIRRAAGSIWVRVWHPENRNLVCSTARQGDEIFSLAEKTITGNMISYNWIISQNAYWWERKWNLFLPTIGASHNFSLRILHVKATCPIWWVRSNGWNNPASKISTLHY